MGAVTVDLVQWLTAQLDADERIARAAARLSGSLSGGSPAVGERWRVSGSHADDGGTYWSVTTASPDLDRIPVVEMVGSGMSGGGAHTEEVAAHIVRHDPSRVLREVGRKQQLLARYEELRAHSKAQGLVIDDVGEEYLNFILPGLAADYSDRPGFAEAIASVE